MKVETITFSGTEQGRNSNPAAFSTKDQDFLHCVPEPVTNPLTGKSEFYINKLPYYTTHLTTNTTNLGRLMIWSGNAGKIVSTGSNAGPVATFNVDTAEIGLFTTTTYCTGISETTLVIAGISVAFVAFTVSDNTAWYYASDAGNAKTIPFTGTTHTNTTMDGIASTTGMYTGQLITGSGVSIGTRIASVDSANQITLTIATSSSVTATFTRDTMAKIIDADFPANQSPAKTIVGTFVHLNGFAFILCSDGTLYSSDVNSLSSWQPTSMIPADAYPDPGVTLGKVGSYMIVFGSSTIQYFYNAGNAVGSPLSPVNNSTRKIGAFSSGIALSAGGICANCDDYLYFVATSSSDGSGALTIRRMKDAGEPEIISYGVIDKLLNDVAAASGSIYLNGAGSFHGQQCLNISGYLYFPASKLWWRQNIYAAMVGKAGITYSIFGGATVNKSDPHSPDYSGASAIIRTQLFELNLPFTTFLNSLELIYDVRSTSGNTSIQVIKDDYATTGAVRNVDMSTQRARLVGCGSARRFALLITDAVNAPMRIKKLLIGHEGGNA